MPTKLCNLIGPSSLFEDVNVDRENIISQMREAHQYYLTYTPKQEYLTPLLNENFNAPELLNTLIEIWNHPQSYITQRKFFEGMDGIDYQSVIAIESDDKQAYNTMCAICELLYVRDFLPII